MPGERKFTPYLRSTRRLCCGALFPLVLGPVRPTFAGCFGHALSIVSGFVLQWTYSWPEPLHAVLVVEPWSCFKCTMDLRCGRSHLRNFEDYDVLRYSCSCGGLVGPTLQGVRTMELSIVSVFCFAVALDAAGATCAAI